MRIASLYRLDNVPILLRPGFLLYGWGLGLLLYLYFWVVYWTSRIEQVNETGLVQGQTYIYAFWHHLTMINSCAFAWRGRYVLLHHPAWYMKPVEVVLTLSGLGRFSYGSSGHGGRAAAEQLVKAMKQESRSTFVTPDGPFGPKMKLRKGVLHIAYQTGLPIVPVRPSCSRYVIVPSWDRKVLPLPFGRLRIEYGQPIEVQAEPDEAIQAKVQTALGQWSP